LFDEQYTPLPNGLPGPLPQVMVDAADPDVNPGRAVGLAHHRADATGAQVDERARMAYWEAAGQRLDWDTEFSIIHSWTKPHPDTAQGPVARWYEDGKLNVAVNCLDRHVAAGHADKVALYFEGEPGDRRTVTYRDLLE